MITNPNRYAREYLALVSRPSSPSLKNPTIPYQIRSREHPARNLLTHDLYVEDGDVMTGVIETRDYDSMYPGVHTSYRRSLFLSDNCRNE